MTREEAIESLTLLKEQARNSGANTFVWDIKIDSFNFVIDSAIKALKQVPKTGHWIDCDDSDDYSADGYDCSVCGDNAEYATSYCPNCGAKMVEPQESED